MIKSAGPRRARPTLERFSDALHAPRLSPPPSQVLVLRFSAAPKGPKQESPGQRPGDLIRMKIPPALNGRNKILDHKPVLPLQGVVILNTRSDSQGGALGWHVAAPSG